MSDDCSHEETTERIRGDGEIVVICANCGHQFGELA